MLTVVIQAGGESRRMGQDKALRPFLGRPLIQRVLERVAPLADEIIVTTNRPEAYTFLDLPLVPDLLPGRGALGGLYTALSAATHPYVAVVACDMPFVSASLLQEQVRIMHASIPSTPIDVVIPHTEEGMEPFHAVYRRAGCLPLITTALQADRWRVDAWFGQANLHYLNSAELQPYTQDGLAFWNVNTPEEFAEAEELAQENPTL